MHQKGNIDPTLRALNGRGRYQVVQLLVINIGAIGAAYQLLSNIFIGRAVGDHRCAAPDYINVTDGTQPMTEWNSSHVTYGKCKITVSKGNLSDDTLHYPCRFGYEYEYRRELSFRTEFDLVCDQKLLGALAQTVTILGQGFGAVLSSIFSDRFGRKWTVLGSQLGLLTVGVAIGLSPSYPVLAVFKFLVGGFQQGVIASLATISIELFPMEDRSLAVLADSVLWGVGATSMVIFAYLLRDFTWRYLQYALSAMSALIFLVQLGLMDESLRWLVANGKKEAAFKVLKRAARVNGKDLNTVVKTLEQSASDTEYSGLSLIIPNGEAELEVPEEESEVTVNAHNGLVNSSSASSDPLAWESKLEETLAQKRAEKLTVLDTFRHKTLLLYSLITWLIWFSCAFAYFALYMMSTSLHGNRFINYFLTALMELPPGVVIYFLVDRTGRRTVARVTYILAGVGLISSGVLRIYTGNSTLGTLSVVTSLVGMFGVSAIFALVFFYTPEIFPTNMRNQAVGVASFAGRLGGMIAPFMTDLADIAVWAPGAIIGSLCFIVVFLLRFVPETKGRELPHTTEDIEAWKKNLCQGLKEIPRKLHSLEGGNIGGRGIFILVLCA